MTARINRIVTAAWLLAPLALLGLTSPVSPAPAPASRPVAAPAPIRTVADDSPGGATIDGAAWAADRSLAVTTTIAGKPVLNVNLFRGSKPLSHFGFNLVLAKAGDYVGSYDIVGASGSGGTYTPDQLNPDILTFSYLVKGKLAITAYDAAKKTVAGTFSGTATNHAGGKPVVIVNGTFHDLDVTAQP